MIRRIKLKGGPRHGKTYLVPHKLTRISTNGGVYQLTKKQGTWEPQSNTEPATDSVLESGTTLVENKTGEPEPILNKQEWEELKDKQ